jgi:hypothetical protein
MLDAYDQLAALLLSDWMQRMRRAINQIGITWWSPRVSWYWRHSISTGRSSGRIGILV